jgi:solute carrier family 26 (sodium-independent sulfate anion transporter), member 11
MSTVVGNVISTVQESNPDFTPNEIASALAIIAGAIVLLIGLIRCGWIVDLIPLTSLSAFMTGSAITIAVGQVPAMMGITGFSTREAPYRVFINILKNLNKTKTDAAMGLSALAVLYAIRSLGSYAGKRWPKNQRVFFFLTTLRTVFVILLYTMISWLVNMNRRDHPAFKILGEIPVGMCHTIRTQKY